MDDLFASRGTDAPTAVESLADPARDPRSVAPDPDANPAPDPDGELPAGTGGAPR